MNEQAKGLIKRAAAKGSKIATAETESERLGNEQDLEKKMSK